MDFFTTEIKTALEAKHAAQWIAYGPVIFQSARVLRNSGILYAISESGAGGLTAEEVTERTSLSPYGVRVLLESGLSIGLVVVNDGRYTLTKTGHYILYDDLTRVNMDFVHDVCYKGLFSLDKSIETGKPEGLKEFGGWKTIYEGLSQLPGPVQQSWFQFDHFFSDDAFPKVLPLVYKDGLRKLLDIGGNTGKWAIASAQYSPDVHVTIIDLPGQVNVAKAEIDRLGLSDRISFFAADILDASVTLPEGFDAVWMSQFLDCFSPEQIVSILEKCHKALGENGHVFILEPFWDKQRFETAAFCLQQTSLYFTTMANGNSQLYSSETFLRCIEAAGFEVAERTDGIGLCQTLLKCRKK